MQTQLATFNVQQQKQMSTYCYSASYARPKQKKLAMHANNSRQYIYHIPYNHLKKKWQIVFIMFTVCT